MCPLDCPDACSLEVTVEDGRVAKLDGSTSTRSPTASSARKVRRFPEHLYGRDRLLASRRCATATKGSGAFERVDLGRGARPRRRAMAARRASAAAASRSCRSATAARTAAHPGHDRRAPLPPPRRLAPAAHGLRGADRARPRPALYGKMPGVALADYVHARLIVVWGCNPSAHRHPPRAADRSARAGSGRAAGRRRPAPHAARARRPTCTSRCARAPTCRWRWRSSAGCSRTGAPTTDFLAAHATGADELRARAPRLDARARRRGGRRRRRRDLEAFARALRATRRRR